MTKQEINEELEHKRELLRIRRQSLQHLEIQEAKFGSINVPVHIKHEIIELTSLIQTLEAEIARLKTLAAEDKIPVEEAEYRALFSEVWKNGKLGVVEAAKLELVRLRLGIIPERAKDMEQEIRTLLAKENFYKIPAKYFEPHYVLQDSLDIDVGLYLGNAIRLDSETTFNLFMNYYQPGNMSILKVDLNALLNHLLRTHNIWDDQKVDRLLFESFVGKLEKEILDRYPYNEKNDLPF